MPDAVILPFPAARRAQPAATPDAERLATALQDLHAALGEQEQAIKAWRFAMAELSVGVAGLGHAMAAYDGSLTALDQQLSGLRRGAEMLENTADRALRL